MNPWKEERFVVWFLGLAPIGFGFMMAFGVDGALWTLPAMVAIGVMLMMVAGLYGPLDFDESVQPTVYNKL